MVICHSLYAPRQKVSSLKSLFTYLGSKDYRALSDDLWLCLAQTHFDNLPGIRGTGRITKVTQEEMRILWLDRCDLSFTYLFLICLPAAAVQMELSRRKVPLYVSMCSSLQVWHQRLQLISRVSYASEISANQVWKVVRDQQLHLYKPKVYGRDFAHEHLKIQHHNIQYLKGYKCVL